jgi:hypothetical protein
MITWLLILLLSFGLSSKLYAFGNGAGTCNIDANYTSITAMTNRYRNKSKGSYVVTTNSALYAPGQVIEITLSGPTFTGILFKVVDENGNGIGVFDTNESSTKMCDGSMEMALTHKDASFDNLTNYTLFWIAPSNSTGKVYILGYVLKGTRGITGTQEFFRFVRDDDSAISINSRDVFVNSFE